MGSSVGFKRNTKKVGEGRCDSCKRRRGQQRVVAYHCGLPTLCEFCLPLRVARIRRNREKAVERGALMVGRRPTAYVTDEREERQDDDGDGDRSESAGADAT